MSSSEGFQWSNAIDIASGAFASVFAMIIVCTYVTRRYILHFTIIDAIHCCAAPSCHTTE